MITAICGFAVVVAVNVATIVYAATRWPTRHHGRVTTSLAIFNLGALLLIGVAVLSWGAP